MTMATAADKPKQNLNYLPPPVATDEILLSQQSLLTFTDKLFIKTRENPIVPLGVIATTVALTRGLGAMFSGDKKRSQRMMRFRVGAQAVTIIAMVVGCIWKANQSKRENDKSL